VSIATADPSSGDGYVLPSVMCCRLLLTSSRVAATTLSCRRVKTVIDS